MCSCPVFFSSGRSARIVVTQSRRLAIYDTRVPLFYIMFKFGVIWWKLMPGESLILRKLWWKFFEQLETIIQRSTCPYDTLDTPMVIHLQSSSTTR